jgi:hypothetical protein
MTLRATLGRTVGVLDWAAAELSVLSTVVRP